jgi:putative chitinase
MTKLATDNIDIALLRAVCPNCDPKWVEPVRKACLDFEINTIRRISAFIAQMAVESQCFTKLDENMNYTSAERIKAIFGQGTAGRKRFPTLASCGAYVRNPEKLANYVYANRMGNGPVSSGDGWKFRGGTLIHLTGRDNWTAFANALGMSVEAALIYGRTPQGAAVAAAWFWEENDINRLADTPGVADESKAINGGTNGLDDRKAKFDKLVAVLLKRQ